MWLNGIFTLNLNFRKVDGWLASNKKWTSFLIILGRRFSGIFTFVCMQFNGHVSLCVYVCVCVVCQPVFASSRKNSCFSHLIKLKINFLQTYTNKQSKTPLTLTLFLLFHAFKRKKNNVFFRTDMPSCLVC